LAWLVDL